ncbi:MAG: PD40 domain-containing protein [Planctomycetales bacterium]|nr:PD40 domain-containing protein [Planctomycetales bacterium]
MADPAIVYVAQSPKGSTTTYDLMVMDADGRNQTKLLTSTNAERSLSFPAWSPDISPAPGYQGTIAIETQPDFGNTSGHISSIILVDVEIGADGVPRALNERVLVDETDGNVASVVAKPDWSPDLNPDAAGYQGEIVFTTIESINVVSVAWNESTMNPSVERVSPSVDSVIVVDVDISQASVTHPKWSPDGQRIAFQFRDSATADYAVAVVNGTGPDATITNLIVTAFVDEPAWSRAGDRIAFATEGSRRTTSELWAVNLAAPNNVELLAQDVASPSWTLDDPVTAGVDEQDAFMIVSGGGIHRVDLATGELTTLAESKKSSLRWPDLRPFDSNGWAPALSAPSSQTLIAGRTVTVPPERSLDPKTTTLYDQFHWSTPPSSDLPYWERATTIDYTSAADQETQAHVDDAMSNLDVLIDLLAVI